MASSADWLVPHWPAPSNVRAMCSTRAGGVSQRPYASLNLGDHVGDDPAAVATNRAAFAAELGARPVFLKQVHGRHVEMLDEESEDGLEADGCITAAPGVACTMMVADCMPLLFTTRDGAMVGAAHAGWRGLAGGVVEAVVYRMCLDAAVPPSDVIAWLGPCIGPDAFEVGDDVKGAFGMQGEWAFKPHGAGKWLADLPGLARARLRAMGVDEVHGNDGSTQWCTVANPSRFFSHRRDRVSGRFAACVWRG